MKAERFSDAIVSVVDALNKRDEEDDKTFVRRAALNSVARPVKEANLKDNLAQAHASGLEATKYSEGRRMLKETSSQNRSDETHAVPDDNSSGAGDGGRRF